MSDDKRRQSMAKARGLSPNASWDDIVSYDDNKRRQEFAKRKGLSSDATWEQISKAKHTGFQMQKIF